MQQSILWILQELQEKNIEFPSFDNGDQQTQAVKKIEEFDMVSMETDHLWYHIVSPLLEEPNESSEENVID